MPPRRGEVWFAYTPGRPDDPHQPRPALVVSADVRNAHRDHIIVTPIFTWGRPSPVRLALAAGVSGLDHDSMVFCDEHATVDLCLHQRWIAGPATEVDRLSGSVLPLTMHQLPGSTMDLASQWLDQV